MSATVAYYETAQKILGPVSVAVLKVLAFLLEFLLHLTEKIFLDDRGVKPCYGDRLSWTSAPLTVVIQDSNVCPVA